MVKLVNVLDVFTAEQIVALLQDNDIAVYSQAPHAGGMMNILGRISLDGYDIFVDDSKLEEAKELMTLIISDEPEDETEEDGPSEDCE